MDEQPERRNCRRDYAHDPTAGSEQRQHESILACDGRAGMDAPRRLGTVKFPRAPPGFGPTQDALKELPVWTGAPRAHPICYPLLVSGHPLRYSLGRLVAATSIGRRISAALAGVIFGGCRTGCWGSVRVIVSLLGTLWVWAEARPKSRNQMNLYRKLLQTGASYLIPQRHGPSASDARQLVLWHIRRS